MRMDGADTGHGERLGATLGASRRLFGRRAPQLGCWCRPGARNGHALTASKNGGDLARYSPGDELAEGADSTQDARHPVTGPVTWEFGHARHGKRGARIGGSFVSNKQDSIGACRIWSDRVKHARLRVVVRKPIQRRSSK